MEEKKQNITLHVGIHPVNMTVDREREAIYREAAKQLNENYALFLARFPKLSAEKLWMYVALDLAAELQEKALDKGMEEIEERLTEITKRIKDCVDKED